MATVVQIIVVVRVFTKCSVFGSFRGIANTHTHTHTHTHIYIYIYIHIFISFCSLSYDKSIASSKASSPQGAI
jgi:hypothetical protein